jgi:RNA polymerase sigma-70 factor (ECF subfamily)
MTSASEAALGLFQEHGAAVYRFAAVLVRHHQDAEDVVQETFLKLLRHLDAGGDATNLRGWLFTVAAHAARDRQRRRGRWIPWLPVHEAHVPPPVLPDEDGRLKRARDALRRLPVRDRLLLALRAQGLSYRDIASAARIKPASVGRLLARAVGRWEAARANHGDGTLGKDGESYDLLERQSHPGAR